MVFYFVRKLQIFELFCKQKQIDQGWPISHSGGGGGFGDFSGGEDFAGGGRFYRRGVFFVARKKIRSVAPPGGVFFVTRKKNSLG